MRPGFRVLNPVVITPAMLESNAPLDDYEQWSSTATYAAKDRVIHEQTIYQSTIDGNVGNATSDIVKWTRIGPINMWRAFDLKHSSRTTADKSLVFNVTPGRSCEALALLNMEGVHTINISAALPGSDVPIYSEQFRLGAGLRTSSWHAFFFSERRWKRNFRVMNLPRNPRATISVELVGHGTVGVGVFLLGRVYELGGGPRYGARLSIRDTSRSEPDDFGEFDLQVGAYNDTPSYVIRVDNNKLTDVKDLLAGWRGTPVYCIASEEIDALNVFGIIANFEALIPNAKFTDCSIDIIGVTS